jgi:ABC-2 type transport system permease protein
VATGVVHALFGYNVLFISRRLGRGQLDHTLVQPRPLGLSLAAEGFVPFTGTASVVPGVALMVWAGTRLALVPAAGWPGWWVLLVLNLVSSAGVVAGFSYLWGSLAFRAPVAAEEISTVALRMVDQLKLFPLDTTGPLLTGGLLAVVPVGFVAWYPCRALLGLDARPWATFATPLAASLFVMAAFFAFRAGLRHYRRTGSQRYSTFGHRR